MPVVWYGTVSMFSGSYIYDTWLFQFYNTLFTFLPIMLYSLNDQELDRDYAIRHPETYRTGQQNKYFNRKVMLESLLVCIYESVIVVTLVFGSMGPELITNNHVMFESSTGMVVLTIIVFICNIRPVLFSYGLHAIFILSCVLGVLAYYIIYIIIEFSLYTDIKNTLLGQMSTIQYWLLVNTN
jgi:phospholipid-transporting ATPase